MASTAGRRLRRPTLLFLALSTLLPAAAAARDWEWTPRLSLAERYSDNVYLRPKGLEQSDWITEVSPGLSVRRAGRKLKVDADYSLTGYLYADDTDRSRVRHNLNGQAQAELLEDWFYLDASARASQELIDYVSGIGLGDAVGIQNTRQTYGFTVSPYLKHRFGSDATVELRLRRDQYYASGGSGRDGSANQYSFAAQSGSNFFPLSWNLSYSRRETDYQSLADTDSEQGAAYARLQLRQGFGLTAQAGLQKGNFPGASNRIRDFSYYGLGLYYTPGRRIFGELAYNWSDSGDFVSGSVTFQPTLRTTLTASSTQRNFGRSHALNLNHRTRKSTWGLVYQESLTSYDQRFFSRLDVWLCPAPEGLTLSPSDPTRCRVLNEVELRALFGGLILVPVDVNQTFVNKQWTGLFSYQLRRATVSLSLFDTRQQYQGTPAQGREDHRTGLQASLSVRPGERTTVTLSTGYSHLEVETRTTPPVRAGTTTGTSG